MVTVNTRAAEFDQLLPHRFIRLKVEFALAVVTQVRLRAAASLQPIGADHAAAGRVFNHQMAADRIEFVGIVSGQIGAFQALAYFKVENFETKTQRSDKVRGLCSKADYIRSLPQLEPASPIFQECRS